MAPFRLGLRSIAAGVMLLFGGGAFAQTLNMAVNTAPTSLDPHFHTLEANNNAAAHIFDRLTGRDDKGQLVPALAESWSQIDDETWEFRLRRDVTFHNGAPFTADDVAYTFGRVPHVPNSPSSFAVYIRAVQGLEIVDAHTLRFKTIGAYPLLPSDLSQVYIISRSIEATSSTPDFNAGRAAVGTGPFRLAAYRPGDRIEFTRNDSYWGPKPAWEKVNYRFIPNEGARVAALRAGDVSLINAVPTFDLTGLRADPNLTIVEKPSLRVTYLRMDLLREEPGPHVAGPNGEVLARNPFRDLRVRQALNLAVNRTAISDRIMVGTASPAGQMMAEGAYGFVPTLANPPFDPDRARRLLVEAGYGQGFTLTIGVANDYYQNAPQVAQALAQMWARIGVRAQVDTMPYSVFAQRLGRGDFAVSFGGWTHRSGEPSIALRAVMATRDTGRGWGDANRNGYSNPQLDAPLERAMSTGDDTLRERLLQQATQAGFEDVGLIPLYYAKNIWATRTGTAYAGRADDMTLADSARPAP